jgi:3-hydroxyisobutyrate dehydrogenase
MSKITVAFIGLGLMGSPMARNLAQQSDFRVKGWNRTQIDRPLVALAASHGVEIVPTLEAAVADADFICTCVTDVPDVREVILGRGGIMEFARDRATTIDFSTIGPKAAREIAQSLQARNLDFLDAPVSGGDIGAQNGTLTIMVGGDRDRFDLALPLFKAVGKDITYCGVAGSGQAVKLCNQVLAAIHAIALCEAIELADNFHLDPQLVVDVCSTGAAGSWALTNLAPKIIAGNFAPGFMVKDILKDLRLVQENIDQLELPGKDLAEQLFAKVRTLDGARQGTQAMIRAYREPSLG